MCVSHGATNWQCVAMLTSADVIKWKVLPKVKNIIELLIPVAHREHLAKVRSDAVRAVTAEPRPSSAVSAERLLSTLTEEHEQQMAGKLKEKCEAMGVGSAAAHRPLQVLKMMTKAEQSCDLVPLLEYAAQRDEREAKAGSMPTYRAALHHWHLFGMYLYVH